MKKLLCIDGNSILNRQFYGIRYLSNRDGFPTNAIFGFLNVLIRQIEALEPDYAAVAFDLKAPTFRHSMYDAYKAGRKPMPEDLALQMPVAKEICRAMGFAVIEREGYEADDILGTLSTLAEDAGDVEAYVLTGDRDSLQLISDKVKVLLAVNSDTVTYDRAAFFEKYGVDADQFVDVKALMGDSSDNIPGVPGIGEKTAFKLISDMGSLDAVYADIDALAATASVKNKLISGKELAFLSRDLARIERRAPIGLSLDDVARKPVERRETRDLLAKYELYGAVKKLGLDKEEPAAADGNAQSATELSVATDASSLKGEVIGLSVCSLGVELTDGETVCRVNAADAEKLITSRKTVAYDCKSIYKALDALGIHFRSCYFDVMLAAYAEGSGEGGYALETLVSRFLGEAYSADVPDCVYALKLWKIIEKKLEESAQLSLFFEIEMPLAAVLCDMEIAGCKVDGDGIAAYGEELDSTIAALESRIFIAAGEEFNVNSPKQLGEVLFEKLMLPAPKKTKTGYSTSAEVLEKLKKYHPIIEDILEYRQMAKLKGTYVDGLLKCVDGEGRIHTEFKQTGTATGRLSSQNPNLQNIPIRTSAGRRFRKYFVPTNKDSVLIDADYSQIELRVLSHVADDENMRAAFISGEDIHTATACRVFGVSPDGMTVELRKRAKAINFGILYGMGEFSLAEDLGISRVRAKEYIDSYLESYPAIEKYLSDVVESAKRDGYVTTAFGRRRYIPELSSSNKNIRNFGERVAKNSPIQGSSADIIKIAMINVSKRLEESKTGARLLLQVHDELLVECPREHADEILELLRGEMENAAKLSVPLCVEAKIGENWLECH